MTRLFSRHPFLTFFIFASLIPVVLVGTLLIFPQVFEAIYGGPLDIDQAIRRAGAEVGIDTDGGSSYLTTFVRLCLVEPLLWLLVIGGAAPTLAGIIVACTVSGRAGLWDMIKRYRPWLGGTGAGSALRTYALMVGVMILAELAIYATRYLLGGDVRATYEFTARPLSAAFLGGFLLSAFFDRGSFLEEPGWRGFALPLLQERMRSPLAASVLLGVGWSLWHLPRDIGFGLIDTLGAARYLFVYLPAFTANCILISIVAAYFCNRTGGSVIPAIIVHGLSNDAVGLSGISDGVNFTPVHQLTIMLPFAILVTLLLLRVGTTLGATQQEKATPQGNGVGSYATG